MMGLGMGLGLVVMLLVWAGLIAGAVLLVRGLFPGGKGPESAKRLTPGSAGEILDRRYARGEITREEYERMKEDLRLSS